MDFTLGADVLSTARPAASDPLVLFPTAALIGVAISAPPGPAGAVCVVRTLRSGVRSGLYCGLGVALGDVLYAFVAAYGVSVLDAVDPAVRRTCAGVAAAILCLAGARMLHSARRDARRAAAKSGAPTAGKVEAHPHPAAGRTAPALARV